MKSPTKKPIKRTALGSWLRGKAPHILDHVGDLLPDQGGLGNSNSDSGYSPFGFHFVPAWTTTFVELKDSDKSNSLNPRIFRVDFLLSALSSYFKKIYNYAKYFFIFSRGFSITNQLKTAKHKVMRQETTKSPVPKSNFPGK